MMKRSILSLFILISLQNISAQGFKSAQMKAPRVKIAYDEKWEMLKTDLAAKGFAAGSFELMIRIFKHEKQVEVWLRSKKDQTFRLFKIYNICYYSGGLGPKRQQGDGQVPEGFYNVAVFNPYSSYYLSLGVSYPNACDKIIGKGNLGGEIMIHGNCLSIGCIPITDVFIKELYVLAVEAKNSGETSIPIWIFPAKMDEAGMKYLTSAYSSDLTLLAFWKNLKTGYDLFEQKKQLPKISNDRSGAYVFTEK